MKTFKAALRIISESSFGITIPRDIVDYEKLEVGKEYDFSIILGDNQ